MINRPVALPSPRTFSIQFPRRCFLANEKKTSRVSTFAPSHRRFFFSMSTYQRNGNFITLILAKLQFHIHFSSISSLGRHKRPFKRVNGGSTQCRRPFCPRGAREGAKVKMAGSQFECDIKQARRCFRSWARFSELEQLELIEFHLLMFLFCLLAELGLCQFPMWVR